MAACDFVIGEPWSLDDAVVALANRLDDTGLVHWTADELAIYLREAVRTYSAFTARYRDRGVFSSVATVPFYALPTELPDLLGFTVTSGDLTVDVEYALMEPPTPTVWTGTEQFNLDLVLQAVTDRTQQFLLETGAVQTRLVQAGVTPDANGRITVDSSVATIRRLAWRMANGRVVPLKREDEWGMTHYLRSWPQNPTPPDRTWPTGYSVGVTPPLKVQLAPAPTKPGDLDIVAVLNTGTFTATPAVLGVPDDWAWVVKWGALADLLSRDGVAYDPQRAAYCEARYQQGIELAKAASVVLNAMIDGDLIILRSLAETDTYRKGWQTVPGVPMTAFTAGQTLLGLVSPPDGAYTVTVDVVRKAPMPTSGSDCLPVDESVRDTILDYAQHLAVFKEGPSQVEAAMGLYERFQRVCGLTTVLDAASVPNRGPLMQQTVQDVRAKDRTAKVEATLP